MKRIAMVCVILMMAMACCGLTACISRVSQSTYANADKYAAGSQTYEGGALTALNIEWKMGVVQLVEDPNATAVTVREDNELGDKLKVHSYLHDGVLDIHFWRSGCVGVVDEKDKHVIVTYRSVEDLNVQMTSGSLLADKVNATNVNIQMTSGDTQIQQLNCARLECQMTSGEMRFGSIHAATVDMKQSSGKTVVDQLTVDTFASKSTSGRVQVSFARANSIDLKMTSGDAIIGIPATGANVSLAKTSGSFKTELDYSIQQGKYVFGDGACTVGIEMTSGTVRIQ